jgi:hypothetical protein
MIPRRLKPSRQNGWKQWTGLLQLMTFCVMGAVLEETVFRRIAVHVKSVFALKPKDTQLALIVMSVHVTGL